MANVVLTERRALAEKIDRGAMTQTEADAALAKTVAATNDQQRQRNAAMWDAMPTSCVANGSVISCNK